MAFTSLRKFGGEDVEVMLGLNPDFSAFYLQPEKKVDLVGKMPNSNDLSTGGIERV
ncbi:hypothetical protein [Nodularia chucula]|uniref:hypothetical protein n=1 Tax=Nodularia chucula TaxID=3093667 RepID=UPI0039C70AB0